MKYLLAELSCSEGHCYRQHRWQSDWHRRYESGEQQGDDLAHILLPHRNNNQHNDDECADECELDVDQALQEGLGMDLRFGASD